IVDYQLPGSGEGRWPLYLPGLVLVTPAGREISGHLQEVGPDGGRLVFYPDLSGDSATIKLKSLGKKLAEERELTIPVPTFE
ncbi:MAG: hypothetical protein H5T99_10785, partial [Moorella sp. (in: Bacteria)]|nr:hypothetical protein [Moorella sp. (in: firmicutes)]